MPEQKLRSNFIKTTDIKTAEQLRNLVLYEVSDTSPGCFLFVNCLVNFENKNIDMKKIQYTDMLCL